MTRRPAVGGPGARPGRRSPGPGRDDHRAYADYLRRSPRRSLTATAFWPRAQPLADLSRDGAIRPEHRTYLSLNRTGLAGSAFELDDRLVASVGRAASDGWTGVKLMTRIDLADPGGAAALELSAGCSRRPRPPGWRR